MFFEADFVFLFSFFSFGRPNQGRSMLTLTLQTFFESDAPYANQLPLKVPVHNRHTLQFLVFAPSLSCDRQILRSDDILGVLGTDKFSDLSLKPQVKPEELELLNTVIEKS